MSPQTTLTLVLSVILVCPLLACAALLEYGSRAAAQSLVTLLAALCLAMLPFISRLVLHIVVNRELSRVCAFTARLRQGGFPEPFTLPVETTDEHSLLRLKRHLNWMLHVLRDRERRLLWRLEETDQVRRDMEALSIRDPLTGLGNRRHFETTLAALPPETWAAGERHLLLIDCDKFKHVNDTHGHQAGDDVLRILAAILLESLREGTDRAFRLGGDEFAALLACRQDQAVAVAERIRTRFLDANGRGCSLSMGLSPCGQGQGACGHVQSARASGQCVCGNGSGACGSAQDGRGASWNAVIARADAALYQVKRAGGNGLRVYPTGLDREQPAQRPQSASGQGAEGAASR
uniref:diguanylate cyclase n=1 Tax=Fundidesulfovibrio putealis TaxID=270496 RepID=A0A7C4EJ46_9BACT